MQPIFPAFKKLALEDREIYGHLVAKYTPFSDISFTTLHIWWDLDEKLYFSVLNGNLVLNYSQPFDRQNAGLSLIGHHKVDESMAALFDFLKKHRRKLRLVHVPEFVVSQIKNKAGLDITEEADMNEYVMDASALAKLEGPDLGRIRRKVNRFLRETEGRELALTPLDLAVKDNAKLVLDSVESWAQKYPKANDPGRTETTALAASVKHHQALDLYNLCVFVDGKLQGAAFYHMSHDHKYLILNHLKVDYATPFIFDYLTNQVAIKAIENGIPYLNMEMDLGIEGLRRHKQGLRPINFLKKYTVKPK